MESSFLWPLLTAEKDVSIARELPLIGNSRHAVDNPHRRLRQVRSRHRERSQVAESLRAALRTAMSAITEGRPHFSRFVAPIYQ